MRRGAAGSGAAALAGGGVGEAAGGGTGEQRRGGDGMREAAMRRGGEERGPGPRVL